MQQFYKGSFIVILSLFVLKGQAQNYSNSPYSRFGMGDLIDNGFEQSRAMGGTAVSLRTPDLINYMNPASYTSQDTMSFIFDVGLDGKQNLLESSTDKKQTKTFNFNHIMIGFPLTRWWKTSVGIVPFSRIGFNYLENGLLGSNDNYNISYVGKGGTNEFYIGNAVEIAHHLSVGINVSYLFGSLDQSRTVSLPNDNLSAIINYDNKAIVHDFHYRFGLQYFTSIKENHNLQLGVTFDNTTNINTKNKVLTIRYAPFRTDTLVESSKTDNIKIPARLAFGISYKYKDNLLVAFDYITQDWTKGEIFGQNDFLASSNSLRFGAEFTPVSITSRGTSGYWKFFHYRLGGHYTNTYIKVHDQQINDYGMSFGIGIPWRNANKLFTNTSFNIAYEFGIRGTLNDGLIKEKYQTLSVGLTLYDFWFVKRKYE